MGRKEIILEAVRRALEIARKDGLIPGKNVAHLDGPMVYELIEINGDIAIVGLSVKDSPTKQEIRKQFPVKELFNPWTAKELMESIMEEEISKDMSTEGGVSILVL